MVDSARKWRRGRGAEGAGGNGVGGAVKVAGVRKAMKRSESMQVQGLKLVCVKACSQGSTWNTRPQGTPNRFFSAPQIRISANRPPVHCKGTNQVHPQRRVGLRHEAWTVTTLVLST